MGECVRVSRRHTGYKMPRFFDFVRLSHMKASTLAPLRFICAVRCVETVLLSIP